MSHEDRLDDIRKEVSDADDTGMIAGEELITEAALLHAGLPPEHPAHSTIDALHAEMRSPSPDRDKIAAHVGELRGIPELEARFVSWWERPAIQRIVGDLGQIGL